MKRLFAALMIGLPALALTACGNGAEPADPASEADAFAKRINANQGAAAPAKLPAEPAAVARPLPGAAAGPYVPGTQTDPASATCGANQMGPFIGKLADETIRLDIVKALGRKENIRFVAFDSPGFISPDPANARLNLMLDAQNIIREARCG